MSDLHKMTKKQKNDIFAENNVKENVKERAVDEYYAEMAGDILGKKHNRSAQMGTGKRQNGRKLYRQAMLGQSQAISHVA